HGHREDPAEEIEVLASVEIDEARALAVIEADRLLVIGADAREEHLLVLRAELCARPLPLAHLDALRAINRNVRHSAVQSGVSSSASAAVPARAGPRAVHVVRRAALDASAALAGERAHRRLRADLL